MKVIRVNSILSNSETKILIRLSAALRLKTTLDSANAKAQFHSIEMIDSIKRYFQENPN